MAEAILAHGPHIGPVTRQPDLFLPMCARSIARQGQLFDTGGPPALTATCRKCGEYLERTPSSYLACPRGHGKLLTEAAAEPEDLEDDQPAPASDWPQQARQIAKRHARRDNWHGRRWHCQCGACSRARLDGFLPREGRR
jgi:hypothetical protein